MDTQLIKECEAKALTWLNSPYYDNETKAEIKAMFSRRKQELRVITF